MLYAWLAPSPRFCSWDHIRLILLDYSRLIYDFLKWLKVDLRLPNILLLDWLEALDSHISYAQIFGCNEGYDQKSSRSVLPFAQPNSHSFNYFDLVGLILFVNGWWLPLFYFIYLYIIANGCINEGLSIYLILAAGEKAPKSAVKEAKLGSLAIHVKELESYCLPLFLSWLPPTVPHSMVLVQDFSGLRCSSV